MSIFHEKRFLRYILSILSQQFALCLGKLLQNWKKLKNLHWSRHWSIISRSTSWSLSVGDENLLLAEEEATTVQQRFLSDKLQKILWTISISWTRDLLHSLSNWRRNCKRKSTLFVSRSKKVWECNCRLSQQFSHRMLWTDGEKSGDEII